MKIGMWEVGSGMRVEILAIISRVRNKQLPSRLTLSFGMTVKLFVKG